MKSIWCVAELVGPLLLFVACVNARPHIVFILADDLGYNDVSFHGSTQIPTPNIDAMAYDGIRLSNYYVHQLCTPTRTALMTGRYAMTVGMQHGVLVGAAPYGVPLNETLLPEYLKKLGYSTHIVGKWHLGFHAREYLPTLRGFDSHFGYYQGCGDYYDHTYVTDPNDKRTWGLDFHQDENIVKTEFGQYSTEIFTSEAERIIRNHSAATEKPLFLYFAQQAVHRGNPWDPLEAPQRFLDKMAHIGNMNRRKYAAMVAALDESVANITRTLDEAGMLNNTVFIFSTDNGGPANGYDYNCANNFPLRGLKNTIWEGGVRGVGFVWSKLLKTSRYVSRNMMHVTDWLPTLLRVAGGDLGKISAELDGVNQWDALSLNLDSPRTEVVHMFDPIANASSIRSGDMKLVFSKDGNNIDNDGWYPPPQAPENNFVSLNFGSSSKDLTLKQNQEASSLKFTPREKNSPYVSHPNHNSRKNLRDFTLYHDVLSKLSVTSRSSPDSDVIIDDSSPDVVTCENATVSSAAAVKNCSMSVCLFNVTADPCEQRNLEDDHPDIVKQLLIRMDYYAARFAYPINKPSDENGLPYHHNGMWVPWIKLSEEEERGWGGDKSGNLI